MKNLDKIVDGELVQEGDGKVNVINFDSETRVLVEDTLLPALSDYVECLDLLAPQGLIAFTLGKNVLLYVYGNDDYGDKNINYLSKIIEGEAECTIDDESVKINPSNFKEVFVLNNNDVEFDIRNAISKELLETATIVDNFSQESEADMINSVLEYIL